MKNAKCAVFECSALTLLLHVSTAIMPRRTGGQTDDRVDDRGDPPGVERQLHADQEENPQTKRSRQYEQAAGTAADLSGIPARTVHSALAWTSTPSIGTDEIDVTN